jgi:hypothetical protein
MNEQEDKLKKFIESEEGKSKIIDVPGKKPWEKKSSGLSMQNEIGWISINVLDLPTKGLFYPEGVTMAIKAALGGEVRHWSTLNESDMSALDDMLNYVIERCFTIKHPTKQINWKDIKEVDRFYILLSIRELTFVNGENKLQVKISETDHIDVTKDMIDYINFSDKLMRYYDAEKRCFFLKFKSGKKLTIDIPSVGLTGWLKNYMIRSNQNGFEIDKDYLNFAPFVIREWRGLNDISFKRYIEESFEWDNAQISMLDQIKKMFADAVNPKIKYTDEGGQVREVALNFPIKSLFTLSDPFSELEDD